MSLVESITSPMDISYSRKFLQKVIYTVSLFLLNVFHTIYFIVLFPPQIPSRIFLLTKAYAVYLSLFKQTSKTKEKQ